MTDDPVLRERIRLERLRRAASRHVDEEEALAGFDFPSSRRNLTEDLQWLSEQPPQRFTIEALHPRGANTLIIAQYKTGKTTLLLNLIKARADGDRFLGRFGGTELEGNFAVWNFELPERTFISWLGERQIENTDKIATLNLRGHRPPPLTTQVGRNWAIGWLASREVTEWAVDPFARAYGGDSENDNTEVGRFLDALDVVKEKAGVRDLWLTTHTPRAKQDEGKERARGATRLDDWADSRWVYTRGSDDTMRQLAADGRDVLVPQFELAYDEDSRVLTATGGSGNALPRALEKLLWHVRNKPGISATDLRSELAMNSQTFNDTKKHAENARLLRVEQTGRTKTFWITMPGDSAIAHRGNWPPPDQW